MSGNDSAAAYIEIILAPDFGVAVNSRGAVICSTSASRAAVVKRRAWWEISGLCAGDITSEVAGKLDHATPRTRH